MTSNLENILTYLEGLDDLEAISVLTLASSIYIKSMFGEADFKDGAELFKAKMLRAIN